MSLFAKYPGGQAVSAGTGGGGNVVGPGSSTANALAYFADTTGKLLASSNILFSSDFASEATLNPVDTSFGNGVSLTLSGGNTDDAGGVAGDLDLIPGLCNPGGTDGNIFLSCPDGGGGSTQAMKFSVLGPEIVNYSLYVNNSIVWNNTGSIGVHNGQTVGPDYRPNNAFIKGGLVVGNLLGFNPPYGLNNSNIAGLIFASNGLANTGFFAGGTTDFNAVPQAVMGFAKDGGFANAIAFTNSTTLGDQDMVLSLLHIASAKTDLIRFAAGGNLSLLVANSKLIVDGYVASAGETVNGNSGASITIDFSTQSAQEVKFTANCTVTLSNPHVGGAYVLRVVNDGTARTITWPGSVLWSGGTAPTLTGTNNKVDLINFYYDGTSYYGSFSLNY